MIETNEELLRLIGGKVMSRADALGGTSGTITSTSGSTFTGPYSSGNTSAPSSGGFDLDLGDMLSGAFKTDGSYDIGKIAGVAGGAAPCLVCLVKDLQPAYGVSRQHSHLHSKSYAGAGDLRP